MVETDGIEPPYLSRPKAIQRTSVPWCVDLDNIYTLAHPSGRVSNPFPAGMADITRGGRRRVGRVPDRPVSCPPSGAGSCSSRAHPILGPLAQLVERYAYTVDVVGSIPAGPTPPLFSRAVLFLRCRHRSRRPAPAPPGAHVNLHPRAGRPLPWCPCTTSRGTRRSSPVTEPRARGSATWVTRSPGFVGGKLALEVLDPDESVLAAIPCIDAFEPSRALVVTDRRVIIRGVRVLRPRHTVRGIPRHHVTGARVEDGWLADGTILRTSTERGLL